VNLVHIAYILQVHCRFWPDFSRMARLRSMIAIICNVILAAIHMATSLGQGEQLWL